MTLQRSLFLATTLAAISILPPHVFGQHSDIATLSAKKLQPAEGLKVDLFAADPLFFNPVAFSIDEKGRFFISETHRYKDSIFDIWKADDRWKAADASFRSANERSAFLEKEYATNMTFLTRDSEAIRLVQDKDGDGVAETSSLFADGFNKPTSGTAAGILARNGEVWFTCIPDLWKFSYSEDGKKSAGEILHTGFGVHIGVSGHDLHGLAFGPDGKIYFSVGDRGASLTNKEGAFLDVPDRGAVFRSNPDGTALEIFATGLRNPQELAFDQWGNLWAHDNDTSGEDKSRVLHVVEGGEYGWRYSYQFMEGFGPWVQEKVWQGGIDDVLPPAGYGAQGPAGLAFYPGVGLPEKYQGAMFAADFPQGVWAYFPNADGASYKVEREKFLWGFGATDVDIGPDCNVYLSDWGTSYNMPDAGRIYRVSDPTQVDSAKRSEVKKLLGEGFNPEHTPQDLLTFLGHDDQRVRFAAQRFLQGKREDGVKVFFTALKQSTNQFARIHAVWGLGSMGATTPALLDKLIEITSDQDSEVRAQAANIIGQARVAWGMNALSKLLSDSHPRVRFYAATGLARLGQSSAVPAILSFLKANAGQDPFLTHAGVYALQKSATPAQLGEAARDENASVRRATLLAMRRLELPEIALFLSDKDARLVAEAARAINDVPVNNAMPKIAELLNNLPEQIAEPHRLQILSRAINANFRLGNADSFARVVAFAARTNAPEVARAMALNALADWEQPGVLDRVVGLWRPLKDRQSKVDRAALLPVLKDVFARSSDVVTTAAIYCVERLEIKELSPALFQKFESKAMVAIRVFCLQALATLQAAELPKAVTLALKDAEPLLRAEGVKLSAKLNPAEAAPLLEGLLATEKNLRIGQAVYSTLGDLQETAADEIMARQLNRLIGGEIKPELQLDLIEAAANRKAPAIKQLLERYEASLLPSSYSLETFRVVLEGGDSERGKKIFSENDAVGCLRCHAVKGRGGIVGPDLAGIAKGKPREFLLESILRPNQEIATGYESVVLTLKNGAAHAGTVKSENETELMLDSPEDGKITLKKADIAKRDRSLSPMPEGLDQLLNKRDLRDLVEYLATLK